jgi:glycosyltransferase involved in cell wall biosynthesis
MVLPLSCTSSVRSRRNRNISGTFRELRRKARGLPIEFHVNASPAVIRDCLSRAIDEQTEPERCEQFGIGVVEAMAAGCIPFVVANGGPSEFVREGKTGFLYTSVGELVDKTLTLLRDPQWTVVISQTACYISNLVRHITLKEASEKYSARRDAMFFCADSTS